MAQKVFKSVDVLYKISQKSYFTALDGRDSDDIAQCVYQFFLWFDENR
ncbi:hypothetical protein KAU39_03635 [bacterium]|nr:hypothetical protein [bacterium]